MAKHEPTPGHGSLDPARCGRKLRSPIQASTAKVRKGLRGIMDAVSPTAWYAGLAVFLTLSAATSGLPDSAIRGLAPDFVWPAAVTESKPGAQFNFQPSGSGDGLRQLMHRSIEFAASEIPLTDEQMKNTPGEVLHLPTTVGAVVFIYDLPGVPANQKLKLTGPVIADIFLDRIKNWNDKSIVNLNTGVHLPDLSVVPYHRADDSGTSYIVTDYLSKVSTSVT